MKQINLISLAILFVFIPIMAMGQGMGCIYDPEKDGKAPMRANLMTRSYTILPESYSLKKYCPTPMSQAQHGTCTAWATTYAARTICEAINNDWTDAESIDDEAFAPIFIYKQLSKSPDCQDGTSIFSALELLNKVGAPKLYSFDVLCADSIPEYLFAEAANYKTNPPKQLFNDFDPNEEFKQVNKVLKVKKALCENRPVIFSLKCFKSFNNWEVRDVWNGLQDTCLDYHAMCVVGFDDNKYGGAFEIMNSWGANWGNNGFIWVKYSDFEENAPYAYEMFVEKAPVPENEEDVAKRYCQGASMAIVCRDGGDSARVRLFDDGVLPYYRVGGNFLSGKRFHIEVANQDPAWVYVLASDKMNNVNILFPYADNISPYLDYTLNDIAIPDETHEFELDTVAGTDYFCVLFAFEELDIHDIANRIRDGSGTFYDKLKVALGDSLAPRDDSIYDENLIVLNTLTDSPIVPIIVEIPHEGVEVEYQEKP